MINQKKKMIIATTIPTVFTLVPRTSHDMCGAVQVHIAIHNWVAARRDGSGSYYIKSATSGFDGRVAVRTKLSFRIDCVGAIGASHLGPPIDLGVKAVDFVIIKVWNGYQSTDKSCNCL